MAVRLAHSSHTLHAPGLLRSHVPHQPLLALGVGEIDAALVVEAIMLRVELH